MNHYPLIGHNEILRYFTNSAHAQRLAHAYTLIGPQGIGRMKVLEEFVPRLIGSSSLHHSDIYCVAPENDIITIETIREVRQWLCKSPLAGNKKAVIIDQAQSMRTEAQNAFLKALEEPSKHTYIFLLVGSKSQLLQTIFSRTTPIIFNPVRIKELRKYFDEARALHCFGIPGRAIAAYDQEQSASMLEALVAAENPTERMRIWMKFDIKKESIHEWLIQNLAHIRSHLVASAATKKNDSAVPIMRDVIEALARPKGQNWQLITENLILAL